MAHAKVENLKGGGRTHEREEQKMNCESVEEKNASVHRCMLDEVFI